MRPLRPSPGAVLENPKRKEFYGAMLAVAELTHAAYDCPNKCDAEVANFILDVFLTDKGFRKRDLTLEIGCAGDNALITLGGFLFYCFRTGFLWSLAHYSARKNTAKTLQSKAPIAQNKTVSTG